MEQVLWRKYNFDNRKHNMKPEEICAWKKRPRVGDFNDGMTYNIGDFVENQTIIMGLPKGRSYVETSAVNISERTSVSRNVYIWNVQ